MNMLPDDRVSWPRTWVAQGPREVGMLSHGCPVHHHGWTGRRCSCTLIFDPELPWSEYEPVASRRRDETDEEWEARWQRKVAAYKEGQT